MGRSAQSMESEFLILHEKDNTVTALRDLSEGDEVRVELRDVSAVIKLRQNIPYAHKFARVFIPRGAEVIKYGEVIGVSSMDIHPGDHVHIHNVESQRARGKAS
jgi:altronate dehydratase small subunit